MFKISSAAGENLFEISQESKGEQSSNHNCPEQYKSSF